MIIVVLWYCMTPSFCAGCSVQPTDELTVTQSHNSYPLHFLFAADAIIVTQSGVCLWKSSWERQVGWEKTRENELMRAAASLSNNRRENGVKRTQNHLSKWTIFYFCDRWLYKEHLRVYLWHMRANFLQHVWLNVYACVQTAMFDDVSFTTGSLCFHRSLWAGWIFPAALWKVTVWMTDGRAAKMKHTFSVNFLNIYNFEECFYLVRKLNLRKNGVVEYSRQSVVNMVDHMIEVFTWLKPQGVTGLIGVNDDLHRQKDCMKDLILNRVNKGKTLLLFCIS